MPERTALIVGASKGLGLALVDEFLRRGWQVIATTRGTSPLDDRSDERLTVERVDITVDDDVAALHGRLRSRPLDLLFVNAAITRGDVPVADVPRETFVEVMVTNAYCPMRFVETFRDLVPDTGTVGIMSSRQGSISQNTTGGQDVYRASKSALNQLMRSLAARYRGDPRTLLLVNPGHVRTELGGSDAPLSIDQSVPGVVDAIEARSGRPGLHFVDHHNETVSW